MSYGGGSRGGDDRYGDKSSYRGGGGGGGQYGGGGGGGGFPSRFGSSGSRGGDSMGQLGAGLRNITWDPSKLPVFEKNFYIEHPAVSSRPEIVSDDWRRSKEITVVGKGVPKPVFSFEEASMPEYVLREVLKQGFSARTYHCPLFLSFLSWIFSLLSLPNCLNSFHFSFVPYSFSHSESGLAHGPLGEGHDRHQRHRVRQDPSISATRHDSHQCSGSC